MKINLNTNHEELSREIDYSAFSKIIDVHLNEVKTRHALDQKPPARTKTIIQSLKQASCVVQSNVHFEEVGTVQHIGNGVANISGLSHATIDGLVEFTNGINGLVLNLHTNSLDVILLGEDEGIQGGSLVNNVDEKFKIPVGNELVGRVVDALGRQVDGGPEINTIERRGIEQNAPEITHRSPINFPLQTGTKIIDALFPIGKGQRELIVGDRQTGKTTLAIDTIINKRGKNVKCIYVSIGQKKSSLINIIDVLEKRKALDYTIILSASPDDPPAQKYLAPFSGMTIAEYFLDLGEDVLIIFDDLTKHANAYRELSLLLRRPPGREAYPGDIFYLHARLLERACKLNAEKNGGSITAIPIITTQQGNISAYIPTNLISICDGQIVLDKEKFNKGFKPAINIGISVSRVGGAAQTPAIRELSNQLKLDLSQFEEVERFTRFGTELDDATSQLIERGQRLQALLTQGIHTPFSVSDQVLILFAATKGFLDKVKINSINEFEKEYLHWLKRVHPEIPEIIEESKQLGSELTGDLKDALNTFLDKWNNGENANE